MNKIEKLIAELCPEGVEWKTLGDVYDFQYGEGNTIPTSGGEYPVYGSNGIVGNHSKYNSEDAPVIGHIGAYAGIVNWAQGKHFVTYNGVICRIKTEVSPKFGYYFLLLQDFRSIAKSGSQPFVSYDMLKKVKIPIPPLLIQEEIVKILETFTTLEAELEAELKERKKQYEYYREELLTFGDDIEWKTLGEICNNVSSGGTPLSTKSDYYGGSIPWLRTQEVRFVDIYNTESKITEKGLKYSSAKWIPANCVIVAISGATAARSAINKIPLTTNQHCCNFEINSEIAYYRYVFHWVSSKYEELKALGQGARADLNAGIIKQFKIAIPPLAEQERIAATLDKFDALVNNISDGLPAELNARRKQYEYYREKLLTFKPLGKNNARQ